MGGDWNINARELMASPLLDELKGVVVSSGEFTFFGGENGEATAEFDDFVVDRRVAHFFSKPWVDLDAETRPHRLVTTTVQGKLHTYSGLFAALPKAFPLDRPHGPSRPPPSWSPFSDACKRVAAGVTGNVLNGRALETEIDAMWRCWNEVAEEELAGFHDIVGKDASRYQGRGGQAKLVRKPILGWDGHRTFSVSTARGRAFRWLATMVGELIMLTGKLRHNPETDDRWRCWAMQHGEVIRKIRRRVMSSFSDWVGDEWKVNL